MFTRFQFKENLITKIAEANITDSLKNFLEKQSQSTPESSGANTFDWNAVIDIISPAIKLPSITDFLPDTQANVVDPDLLDNLLELGKANQNNTEENNEQGYISLTPELIEALKNLPQNNIKNIVSLLQESLKEGLTNPGVDLGDIVDIFPDSQEEEAQQEVDESVINVATETIEDLMKTLEEYIDSLDDDGTSENPDHGGGPMKQPTEDDLVIEEIDPLAGDNVIHSQRGKGKLVGGLGADEFRFDTFDKFGKKGRDKIIDFNSEEGDFLTISEYAIPGLEKETGDINFATASSRKELRQLSKEGHDFIYFEKKGRLFFDGNGTDKGFGSKDEGGLMAILKGKPELTSNDLQFLG